MKKIKIFFLLYIFSIYTYSFADAMAYWENNVSEIPDGSKYKTQYTQQREAKEQPIGNNDGLKNFALMALSMLLIL